jgi:protein SCO1
VTDPNAATPREPAAPASGPDSVPAAGSPGRTPRRMRLIYPVLALLAAAAALAAFWVARGADSPLASLGLGGSGGSTGLKGYAISPPRAAPDFTMTAHTGEPFRLSGLRGQAVLLFFGYTYCPDICPTTLVKVVAALNDLGGDAEHVTMVFVTVDPKRDTLASLARYLGNFHERILGVRGDEATIAATAKDYGVTYSVDAPPGATADPKGYTISHSGYVFVIDPAGDLRSAFIGDFLPSDMAHDLRLVLREDAQAR